MAGHTQLQWEKKFFESGRACYYCGDPLLLKRAEKDHLTPVSRGGSSAIENIVPACGRCNRLKGKKTEAEFRTYRPIFTAPIKPLEAPFVPLPEEKSEPGLLQRLVRERSDVSWWRGRHA